jgi:glycerol-3-phosphate dehydrogenase (NAD(P)+)
MAKVSIIGAGSWGLGLAILLNNNGHEVKVWSVFPAEIEELKVTRENKKCLPGVKIPESVEFTADTELAVTTADVIVMAVASPYTRSTSKIIAPIVKKGQYIVNVGKGIEEDTLLTLCQIIEQEIPQAVVAVLSGPSHAEEVGRGIPTTCVIGTHKKKDAEYLQNIFMSDVFRVYTSPDMLGICIGGALKNVIALAAGIADGLGYGDNTKAALITRGIAEISRLGLAMGADMVTFSGLSGIGDLIVTCASMHSRNRRAGILIGKGYSKDEAMQEVQMVVEGVFSAKAGEQLAKKYNVEMPIVEQVNKVLFEGKSPEEAVKELMLRDKKIENDNSIEWKE